MALLHDVLNPGSKGHIFCCNSWNGPQFKAFAKDVKGRGDGNNFGDGERGSSDSHQDAVFVVEAMSLQ